MKFATLAALVATTAAAPDCDSKGCTMCMVQTEIETGRVKDTRCGPPMAECLAIAAEVNASEPESELTCNPQEEAELIETIRKSFSAKDVANAFKQLQAIGDTIKDMHNSVSREDQEKMERMHDAIEKKMHARAPAYMHELQEWMGKPSFKESKAYKMGPLMHSKEFGKLASNAMKFEHQVENVFNKNRAGFGFDKAGNYSEWLDNQDMIDIFEEIYSIKEDLKAFVMSKEMARSHELGMKTLQEPPFENMVKMLEEDFIHNEELKMRLMKVGMEIKTKLQGCPFANRLARQVVTLHRFAQKAAKFSDVPDKKILEKWWNSKNFQPWE